MSAKLVQRGYPGHVRRRLDPQRPKYSTAVRSIAAFAESVAVVGNRERVFDVLIAHLDDACKEARTHNLSRLPNLIKLKGDV